MDFSALSARLAQSGPFDPLVMAGIAAALAAMLLAGGLLLVILLTMRARRRAADAIAAKLEAERADQRMLELQRMQAETAGQVRAMGQMLHAKQAELQQAVHTRLDAVSDRLDQSMQATTKQTTENLSKLNERLAVIDRAQKNITDLASQVTSLTSVLSNKQQRGAFGQGRMEMIIQDGLAKGSYEFQFTLSNRTRPDCAIFLPDQRPLVIDAKFPLEAVHRVPRGANRRGAPCRGQTPAPAYRRSCERYRQEIPDPRRDAGPRADVRAFGIGLRGIA